MAVVPVGATANNGGVNSVASVSVAPHASAAVGDLALIVCSNDRGSVAPVVTAPTAGYVSGYAAASTNIGAEMGWKRLTAGDLGNSFTATYSTARRCAILVIVLRGATDPEFTNKALASSSASFTGPSVTPTVADSMLVVLSALALVNAPFTRTFSPSAGWTEPANGESESSNAGTNAAVEVAYKLLSGGTSLQTAVTLTPSDTTSALVAYQSTVVVAPAVNVPPTVTSITPNQNVAAGATVNLAATVADTDGTIASQAWTYDYPASGGPALTGGTTLTPSFTAGSAGALYVLRCTVTDNDGGTGFATTEVRVPVAAGSELTPLAAYGGTGAAVTNTGGAASEEAALADGTLGSPNDTTYLLFAAATAIEVERRWRLKPSVPLNSLVVTPRVAQDVAGTLVSKVRIYEGNTLKAEWTLAAASTSFGNQTLTMTSVQCAAVGDWGNLWAAESEST